MQHLHHGFLLAPHLGFHPSNLCFNISLHESLLKLQLLLRLLLCLLLNIGIIDDNDAAAAELASSVVTIDEANLSIDFTINPLLSESEFFIFLLDKDSEPFFTFFLTDC